MFVKKREELSNCYSAVSVCMCVCETDNVNVFDTVGYKFVTGYQNS